MLLGTSSWDNEHAGDAGAAADTPGTPHQVRGRDAWDAGHAENTSEMSPENLLGGARRKIGVMRRL